MRIDRLIATCRRRLTDLTNFCFVTALGLSAAAAVGFLVNTFIAPWPQTGLLVAGAGFYTLLGIAYLLRDLRQTAQHQTVVLATTAPHPRVPMLGRDSDDYPSDFESSPSTLEDSRQRQDVMAGV